MKEKITKRKEEEKEEEEIDKERGKEGEDN